MFRRARELVVTVGWIDLLLMAGVAIAAILLTLFIVVQVAPSSIHTPSPAPTLVIPSHASQSPSKHRHHPGVAHSTHPGQTQPGGHPGGSHGPSSHPGTPSGSHQPGQPTPTPPTGGGSHHPSPPPTSRAPIPLPTLPLPTVIVIPGLSPIPIPPLSPIRLS